MADKRKGKNGMGSKTTTLAKKMRKEKPSLSWQSAVSKASKELKGNKSVPKKGKVSGWKSLVKWFNN